MDSRAPKSALRREIVERIRSMDPDDRRSQELALAQRFEDLPGFHSARSILLFASAFPEEFDTRPMLRRTLELGKRLILPRVDPLHRQLRVFQVDDIDQDLVPGHRGILEPGDRSVEVGPEAIDWVMVPGLGFNHQGYRLGRGAGYYDRLLPRLRPDSPRWALILDVQWSEALPIEPHDQPVDGVADHRSTIQVDRRRITR